MTFSVASYNILAPAYIERARYPRTPALVLNAAWRTPALLQRVCALDADVLCLQEVEPEFLVALRLRLGARGYRAQYARKNGGRPDGCAIFYRENIFELSAARALAYADGNGAADSGYVALIVTLQSAEGILGIINTHLTWDPPDTPREARRGPRQINQLLGTYESMSAAARGWIVAGDLNVTPDDESAARFEAVGFDYAHRGVAGFFTCNVNGRAKMIDYLFHSRALRAEPQILSVIDDRTILPSAEHPSDHLPIAARFLWRS